MQRWRPAHLMLDHDDSLSALDRALIAEEEETEARIAALQAELEARRAAATAVGDDSAARPPTHRGF